MSSLTILWLVKIWILLASDLTAAFGPTPQDGDLKLIDGPSETMGTVLVYRGYSWGRICDDHWTMKEAEVVCRQLGMGRALEAHRRNHYSTRLQANYFMDEVRCTGTEERLIDCRFAGWAVHDCKRNEEAGVKCAHKAPVMMSPRWNPLKLPYKKQQLEQMAAKPIQLIHPKEHDTDHVHPVLIELSDGTRGSVCPDYFRATEAIVFCKQIGAGIGGLVVTVPRDQLGLHANHSIAIIGRCYGNETDVNNCIHYASKSGIICDSDRGAAVQCVLDLPDLIPDRYSLETSSYLQKMSLWQLECALEENCLPDSVYRIIDNNPQTYKWLTRTLLRFSSIIENVGTAAFRPKEKPEKWEWHACHMHYHSMKVFSRYEIIDPENRLVSVGMKASFCLEDNMCDYGVVPKFRCSNVVHSKGTQGISPGCKDMYLHDYDCQWIDVTDIAPGKYTFQVSFNPDFYVAESNFFNNALRCELTHLGHHAVLRMCHHIHPHELL